MHFSASCRLALLGLTKKTKMMKNAPSDKTKRVSVSFYSSKDRKRRSQAQSQENLRNKYTNALPSHDFKID